MSNSNYSYTASAHVTSSFSQSSSDDPQGKTKVFSESLQSNDRDGTTIRRVQQETGKPTLRDESYIPPGGRGIASGSGDEPNRERRIEDVTDQDQESSQAERDRLYEERMEDEYAKREGGA